MTNVLDNKSKSGYDIMKAMANQDYMNFRKRPLQMGFLYGLAYALPLAVIGKTWLNYVLLTLAGGVVGFLIGLGYKLVRDWKMRSVAEVYKRFPDRRWRD